MTNSTSDKIIKNTIFNAIGRFWGIIVTLFLTPYIISRIGLDRYGVWTLAGVATSYFSLLDFGVGTSFVKYISEANAKNEDPEVNRIVNTGLIFYSLFGIMIIIAGFPLVKFLVSIFKIPVEMRPDAAYAFAIGMVIFALSNAFSVFASVQTALQRMDISNRIAIAVSVPTVIGTVFVLEHGYGLVGLMVNNAAMLLLSSALNILFAFRLLPSLRLSPAYFSLTTLKKFLSFGIKMQVANLAGLLTFQGDKLIISYFLNVSFLGAFQLGRTVVDKARELPLLLISAVIPAAADLDAKGDHATMRELYLRGLRYLAVSGIPLVTFVFFTAPVIMFAWIGPGCGNAVVAIRILAPAYIINYLTGMATTVAQGAGKPHFQMRAALLHLFLAIPLSIVCAIKFGFPGIISATAFSLSASSLYFAVVFHKNFGYPLKSMAVTTLRRPLLASLGLGCGVLILNRLLLPEHTGRLAYIVTLIVDAVLFFSAYVYVILSGDFMDDYDRRLFKDNFNRLIGRFRAKRIYGQ